MKATLTNIIPSFPYWDACMLVKGKQPGNKKYQTSKLGFSQGKATSISHNDIIQMEPLLFFSAT
jgi:hypothetical protein